MNFSLPVAFSNNAGNLLLLRNDQESELCMG